MSAVGKPAITSVVEDIEHFFIDLTKTYTHTLDDNFTKQAIGLMVKTILEPFGYTVWKQKDLPKNSRATTTFDGLEGYAGRGNIMSVRFEGDLTTNDIKLIIDKASNEFPTRYIKRIDTRSLASE